MRLNSESGIPLGTTVASKLLRKLRGRDERDFVDDFSRLPLWCLHMQTCDPAGHYLLKTTGDNRFESLYMFPSSARKFYDASSKKILCIDGCGVRTIAGGAILGAFMYSSARELQLIAIMYCKSENGPECLLFVERLKAHLGHIDLIIQDAGVSLIPACEKNGISWRRCVQHVVKNVHDEHSVPQSFDQYVYLLAEATTEQLEKAHLNTMRKEFPKHLNAVAWIENCLPEFVSRYFLERGIPNFTQKTNNAAEQAWEFIEDARSLPVIAMLDKILESFCDKQRKERDAALERKNAAEKQIALGHGTRLTIVPSVVEELEGAQKRMMGKKVAFLIRTPDELRAVVELSKTDRINAEVRLCKSPPRASCSHCLVFNNYGYMCDCMIAVVHAASQIQNLAGHWSVFMKLFIHKHWTLPEWVAQKEVMIQLSSYSRAIVDLNDNGRLLSWRHPPVRPGRKKKKNQDRKEKKDGIREYRCAGCGEDGHSIKRCPKIDLDLWRKNLEERYNSVKSKKPRLSKGQLDAQRVARDQEAAGTFVDINVEGFVWGQNGNITGDQDADGDRNGGELVVDDDQWPGMAEAVNNSRASDLDTLTAHLELIRFAKGQGLVENNKIAVDGSCFFDAICDQLKKRRSLHVGPLEVGIFIFSSSTNIIQSCVLRVLNISTECTKAAIHKVL